MNETAGIKTGSENSKVVFPDYRNSIVNLSNSIMDSFGVDPLHTVLKQLPKSTISAKNVVLLVLDGLGMELLNSLEPGIVPFLKESVVGNLSSVYPSTTTAALTSLLTGMTPIEHGALGWSLFFKEFRRFVDFLPLADSDSHEFLDSRRYPLHEMMGFKTIFERIGERDISVEQFFLSRAGYPNPASHEKPQNPPRFFHTKRRKRCSISLEICLNVRVTGEDSHSATPQNPTATSTDSEPVLSR